MTNQSETEKLVAAYRKANESYSRVLVFRTGIDAGFFAEFRYLVHAVVYCLENRLQLKLYSRGANYACGRGWTDWFEPFCQEVDEPYHSKLNVHSLPALGELCRTNPHASAGSLAKWKLKTSARRRMCRVRNLMAYGSCALSTSDIPVWNVRRHISLPQIGVEGNYIEVFAKIASMLWRFNGETREAADALIKSLGLPEAYSATQIRGGDKVTEIELYQPSLFVDVLDSHNAPRDVLLLTDDYAILETVRRDYPRYTWHSLCSPEEHGYYNKAFASSETGSKRRRMVRFLAQIDAMMQAGFFTGSISVGPSLFLLEMMYPDAVPTDCRMADLPHVAQLSIPARDAVARRFLQSQPEKDALQLKR